MNTKNAKELIEKYQAGTATPEEVALIEKWVMLGTVKDLDLSDDELANDFSMIRSTLPLKYEAKRMRLWPRIAVAAAAVAAIVVGVWLYSNKYQDASIKTGSTASVNDIAPGKNGATITLANGKVIQLSDKKLGVVIGDDDLKYNDGSDVRYSSGTSSSGSLKSSQNSSGPVGVHSLTPNSMILTASTARGQTYQFTLSDGTKVWLNADSKLEFPSNFVNSKTRNVKLSGEGYFEVAKDKAHPFIVTTDEQEVEVLGTHFNISSYAHSGTVTSLLEGAVKLTNKIESRVLKPGERGIATIKGIMLVPGDVNDAVAWKNGYFRFRGEQIQTIMDQLARWYDIEVSYQGKMPQDGFNGKVSRNKNISQVLKALEAMKIVHFKVEGRRVTVIN
jgi:ferric-dicitrate binding protein FerR (iron transport regulator)